MNPKFKFHFLVTAILFGNSSESFPYSSDDCNLNKKELIETAQKQFPNEAVLEIESTTRYSPKILRLLLKPTNDD
jgi:hypothetical protein